MVQRQMYPVFEAVGVPALFAAQVNEEVCRPGTVLGGHVPHDAEGVAGHLTYLDVARGGEGSVHFCHLPLSREMKGGYLDQSAILVIRRP